MVGLVVAYGSFGGFDVCEDLGEVVIRRSAFQIGVTING
jgi:hypothetical protein